LEGDLKRPKGIWGTAQKTFDPEEWGKLPLSRTMQGDEGAIQKLRRKMERWKEGWMGKKQESFLYRGASSLLHSKGCSKRNGEGRRYLIIVAEDWFDS